MDWPSLAGVFAVILLVAGIVAIGVAVLLNMT